MLSAPRMNLDFVRADVVHDRAVLVAVQGSARVGKNKSAMKLRPAAMLR